MKQLILSLSLVVLISQSGCAALLLPAGQVHFDKAGVSEEQYLQERRECREHVIKTTGTHESRAIGVKMVSNAFDTHLTECMEKRGYTRR